MLDTIRKIIAWYKRPNKGFIADTLESLIVIIPVVFLIKTCVFGLYVVPTCSMENTMLVGERFFADKMTPFFRTPERGEIIAINDPVYRYSRNPIINFYERYVSLWITSWTKRVIGIPGDHIQGVIEEGKPVVYRNGEKLDESYLNQYPIIELYNPDKTNYQHGRACRTFDPSMKLDDPSQPFYKIDLIEVVRGKQHFVKNIHYPSEAEAKDVFDVHLGKNEYWLMGDNRRGSYDSRNWGALPGHLIHGRILLRLWSSDSDEAWAILDLIKHPIDFWKRIRWSRCFNILR